MTSRSGTRILIVEDEAVVALDIERRVRDLGYAVAGTAASAEDALKIAELERPDLVLMDIRLRGIMDGIEAGRQIRSQWGTPVVYLTAHADEATLARAKETAPHGYIIKPFDEQKLRVALEVALARHERDRLSEGYRRDLEAILDALPNGAVLVGRRRRRDVRQLPGPPHAPARRSPPRAAVGASPQVDAGDSRSDRTGGFEGSVSTPASRNRDRRRVHRPLSRSRWRTTPAPAAAESSSCTT